MNPPASDSAIEQELAKFSAFLQQDPTNPHLLAKVIDLALDAHELERAERHLQSALAVRPDDPFMLYRQGLLLSARHQWVDAAHVLARVHASHPDLNVGLALATAQFQQGQYAAALAALAPYEAMPDLPPHAATLLLRVLHHTGAMERAATVIDHYLPSLEQDAGFAGTAALALFDLGEVERADRLAQASLAMTSKPSLEALVVCASVALARNENARARVQFEQALQLRPDDGRSWSGLGMSSMLAGDLVQATQELERAVQYMPGHIGTWHLLGWSRLFQRDLAGAKAAFGSALERDRNFGESHGAMAVVLAFEGEREAAQSAIERALRLDPQGMSARYAGMVLANQADDPVHLREVAERLLRERAAPGDASLTDMLKRFQLSRH